MPSVQPHGSSQPSVSPRSTTAVSVRLRGSGPSRPVMAAPVDVDAAGGLAGDGDLEEGLLLVAKEDAHDARERPGREAGLELDDELGAARDRVGGEDLEEGRRLDALDRDRAVAGEPEEV